jgi:hypothetical protein
MPNYGSIEGQISPVTGLPHDWTEGSGVFPGTGVITIPNPGAQGLTREWLYVQNQDTTPVTVSITCALNDGSTTTFGKISLGAASIKGGQGGSYEQPHGRQAVSGPVVITGTAGNNVCVMEKLK